MTTMINLLPWREERRKQRQHEFIAMLAFAALLAGLIFWLWKGMVEGQIADQQTRNNHIQSEIAKLDTQIKEINELQRRRDQLVARMKVIQELQGNRPIIVRVLDQLVRTVPDGVFYTLVGAAGGDININGVAESNNRVSSLMRRLDASEWLKEPNLDAVRAAPSYGEQANTFNLKVKVDLPQSDEGS